MCFSLLIYHNFAKDVFFDMVFYTRWRYYGAFKSVNFYWMNEEVILRRLLVTCSLRMWDLCF